MKLALYLSRNTRDGVWGNWVQLPLLLLTNSSLLFHCSVEPVPSPIIKIKMASASVIARPGVIAATNC